MDNFGPKNPRRPSNSRTQNGRAPQGVSSPGATQVKPRRSDSSNKAGAQPRKKKSPSRPSLYERISGFFTSKRTRLGLAITLLILSVVWLLVAINYFKTGIADQSLASGMSISQMADAPEGVENIGGAAGAKLAHIMMVDGLGISSVVLVIYFGVLALSLLGFLKCKFWSFTFKCLFTAVALSVIIGLFTYNAETAVHWGGVHGHYVNWWLMHTGSGLLALAVTVFLIGMLAVMYLTQLISFYRNVTGSVQRAREAMALAAGKARSTSTELADVPESTAEESEENVSEFETPEHTTAPVVGFSIDDIEEIPDSSQETEAAEPIYGNYSIADVPETETDQPNKMPTHSATATNAKSEPEFVINDPGSETDIPMIKTEALENSPEALMQPFNIRDILSNYKFPTADLLIDRPITLAADSNEQEENKNMIVNTLSSFGIGISKISATIGPTITLYEIVPADGVRISQIRSLEDDIALQLAALGIRIIAPIPGKGTIGIEVPNRDPQTVSMYSVINSKEFKECKMLLPMALGSTINNRMFIADLAKMPHLLVAGATGQGKSVGLNCIIASLLYKKHPGELKFVLVDPKMVEFSLYSRLEHHFLAKLPGEDDAIVTDADKALSTLASLCVEMDNRYDLLKEASVRTVEEYNRKFADRRLKKEDGHKYMPYIVIIVDEFADLIMTAGKDITLYIARIAQKARAVGMHMIIATQRPSTDIITGMIKANFPGRIAFRVAQMVDSKTILDRPGANRLIGRGDMLFSHNSMMERVQCAFIDTPEVEALVDFIDRQTGFTSAYILPEPPVEGASGALAPGSVDLSKRDELFDDCARFVSQNPTASTSLLQRRFGIGYAKAGKIMDQLEAAGIVGPALGQKPRAVLIDSFGIEDVLRSLG